MPARDGTLRVLRAARDAGVKRVVLTSSFAAIGCGHGDVDRVFTEDDWTDLNGYGITAYVKSKVLAECAAWDFAKDEGDPSNSVSSTRPQPSGRRSAMTFPRLWPRY